MAHTHVKDSRSMAAGLRAQEADAGKTTFRTRMLYGLIAASAVAITVGIYFSQAAPTGPARAAAASGPGLQTVAASLPGPQAPTKSALASNSSFYDFGSVSMAAGKVRHTFGIANASETPLKITKLFTSCMCTEATLVTASGKRGPFGMPGHAPIPTISEQLDPRRVAQVEVVFDPAAHGPAGVGRIDRVVTVQNDAGAPLELAFTAMVRP